MSSGREVLRLNVDGKYLQRKFLAYRSQTSLLIALTALLGIGEWVLDYMNDPAAAGNHLWARLAFVWMVIPAWGVWRTSNHTFAALIALFALGLAQFHDIAILKTQSGGLTAAVMSSIFYPMVAVLLCLGFSLFVNWAALALVSISPFLLAATGWLDHFPYQLYGMVIWPTSIFLAFICVAFAFGDRRRHLLEKALEDASNTDPLTGVANRRHFQILLQRETSRFLRTLHPCTLLMLDIDHFKRINDSFGHPTGDQVIQALANLCRKTSRDVDVVARLGGEEFAILMPETGLDGAAHLAERIRVKVQELKMVNASGVELHWTVSIGVASLPLPEPACRDPARLGEQLMAQADAALYDAKAAGRNLVAKASANSKNINGSG